MTDDASARPGWYVATRTDGEIIPVFLAVDGRWHAWGYNPFEKLPPWTLGPRIDDLSRDAAMLREVFGYMGVGDPDNEGEVENIALRWVANYHDYKRDAARYRWLREGHRLSEVFVGDRGDAVNLDNASSEDIDALIDAEIARERESGNG